MPQFKVAKTDDIQKLNNTIDNPLIEDKLYIVKETNKLGRLFYDFDNGTRIEFGSFDNTYHYAETLKDENVKVPIKYLEKYVADGNLSTASLDEIQINSIVTNDKSLYHIRNIIINKENPDDSEVELRRIYMHHDLVWGDYYGE